MNRSATYGIQTAIGRDGATLFESANLGNECCNTTRTQPRGTGTNQVSERFEEETLFKCRFNIEKVGEDSNNREHFVGGITVGSARRVNQESYTRVDIYAYVSISDRNAVSNEYGVSILYVF